MAWRTVPTKLAGSWVHGAQAGALPGPLVEVCVEPQLGLNVFASVLGQSPRAALLPIGQEVAPRASPVPLTPARPLPRRAFKLTGWSLPEVVYTRPSPASPTSSLNSNMRGLLGHTSTMET